MKLSLLVLFSWWMVSGLSALPVGTPLAEVLRAKGEPKGRMEGAGTLTLQYEDSTVTLRDGKVVGVKATAATPAVSARPAAASVAPRAAAPKPAAVPELQWSTDYSAALAAAKAQNRKVFLFFTGSDWCGWCMRLDEEILSTEAFRRYAAEELILVKLDFPRSIAQPAGVVAQNKRLARQYSIRGYPTVVVLNSEAQPAARLGYQAGGPAPFIEALRQL